MQQVKYYSVQMLLLATSIAAVMLVETINPSLADTNNEFTPVTSVSQLKDIQPTDWAFQALQSLVERYGVIAGYPDGTFRGNRAMSRYEFAAGLNAALNRINELISTGKENLVSREDLTTLQQLQTEFANELATLRQRVDVLETRAASLEENQFSTTTKLTGQVVMAVNAGEFEGDRIIAPRGAVIAEKVFRWCNNHDKQICRGVHVRR